MAADLFENLIRRAVVDAAIFSLAPLALSSLIGLAVSFLQALTQIQEQSVGFALKLSVLAAFMFFFWSRASDEFIGILLEAFKQIAQHSPG